MIVRISTNGRLSKPATVVAAVVVLGAGFVLLTFGMVLLAAVAAIGAGVAAATLLRRSLGGWAQGGLPQRDTGAYGRVASADPDRIVLDPALEVPQRREALKATSPPSTPPSTPGEPPG